MKVYASEGAAAQRSYGPLPKPVIIEKTFADFKFMGGSFVHEPVEPSGFLDVAIAPGSPRVPYWPISATVQQNIRAKYGAK